MHLTDAVPVLAGAPSVVQEEGGNDLSRGQGDKFTAITENCAMVLFSLASPLVDESRPPEYFLNLKFLCCKEGEKNQKRLAYLCVRE